MIGEITNVNNSEYLHKSMLGIDRQETLKKVCTPFYILIKDKMN